jgi:hypothetical protein
LRNPCQFADRADREFANLTRNGLPVVHSRIYGRIPASFLPGNRHLPDRHSDDMITEVLLLIRDVVAGEAGLRHEAVDQVCGGQSRLMRRYQGLKGRWSRIGRKTGPRHSA